MCSLGKVAKLLPLEPSPFLFTQKLWKDQECSLNQSSQGSIHPKDLGKHTYFFPSQFPDQGLISPDISAQAATHAEPSGITPGLLQSRQGPLSASREVLPSLP